MIEPTYPNLSTYTDKQLDALDQELCKEFQRRKDLPEISSDEKFLVDNGRVIGAIKFYRCRTGLGLRDSKSVIDNYRGV